MMNTLLCSLACCLANILPPNTDFVGFVCPEMGTVNSYAVSTGNVYPCIGLPWAMNSYSPVTKQNDKGDERWFADWTSSRFYGIKVTHQLSPWIGDYASWCLLPVGSEPLSQRRSERFDWFSHKAEKIEPSAYSVYLSGANAHVRLAPSSRAAVLKVDFATPGGLLVDPYADGEAVCTGRVVSGVSRTHIVAPTSAAPVRGFFKIVLDRAPLATERLGDGALVLRFPAGCVTARLATSFISPEQCEINLREVEGLTYETIATRARTIWNGLLSRVRVASTDVDRLRTFYTCLYRMLLFPKLQGEITESGEIVHWSPADGKVWPGQAFACTVFWDTFRALYPFLTFVYPEIVRDTLAGAQNCWRESGWLPEISAPGLTDCMIGNNIASVIVDAQSAGLLGSFDYGVLADALVHETTTEHPELEAIGRRGAKDYLSRGYVPCDVGVKESAARTIEYAYADACVAKLLTALGRTREASGFADRAQNWRNVFNPAQGLVSGRQKDGAFKGDFNPDAWGGDFTEGSARHYTFSVFHDIPGLATALGGTAALEKELDNLFALPPTADWSAYGLCIHEIREMQIMGFGQYAHGNQPIQHAIYLYDWAGAWPKAQYWSREVLDRLYRPTPDGYCGDEDNGQTSAWYVWSALGLYPANPLSGEYALGAPLFDEAEVSLPSGRTLRILAPGAAVRTRFSSFILNGSQSTRPFVSRAALCAGGELRFTKE